MGTRIEQIREAVEAHFYSFNFLDLEENDKASAITTRREDELINEHAAMKILRDLLPLLEAAVVWDDIRWDTEKGEQVKRLVALHTEITKLRENV